MTIRDIEEDIIHLFDLDVPAPRGTFNVRYTIKYLIYEEFFIGNKELTDIDLEYFILNPDISLNSKENKKRYGTMNTTISEWANLSGNTARQSIRDICCKLDIHKMYQHFEYMINKATDKNSTFPNEINTWIEKILTANYDLSNVCKSICHKEWERLTWIIMYAMFSNELFMEKYQNFGGYSEEKETGKKHQEDSNEVQQIKLKIGKALNKKHIVEKIITISSIIINVIQVLCLIIPYSLPDKYKTKNLTFNTLCIGMLIVSIILLIARYIPLKLARQCAILQVCFDNLENNSEIFNIFKCEMIDLDMITILPFNDATTIHMNRERNRLYLTYLLEILFGISYIISLIFFSFPVFLFGICISILAYTFLDHHLNVSFYAKRYDILDKKRGEDGKANTKRGLAKMYQWDYDLLTGDFKHASDYEPMRFSITCLKFIFVSAHDRLNNVWKVITSALVALNVVTLVAGILCEYYLPYSGYFKFSNNTFFEIFAMVLIIAIGLSNIILLITINDFYCKVAQLAYTSKFIKSNDSYFKQFLEFKSIGKINELDIARGVYKYNCLKLEQDMLISDIYPEDDRMLFTQRITTHKVRVIVAVWLGCSGLTSLTIWHLGFIQGFILIPIAILLQIIINTTLLPRMAKKLMIKQIKLLKEK